jgi:hypothetical protein
MRKPTTPTAPATFQSVRTGPRLAALNLMQFSPAMYEAAVAAIRLGVPAEWVHLAKRLSERERRDVNPRANRVFALETSIERTQTEQRNLAVAMSNTSETLHEPLIAHLNRLQTNLERFRTELEALRKEQPPTEVPPRFTADADALIFGLRWMARFDDKAPVAVTQALGRLLVDCRVHMDGDYVTLSFCLLLPTERGNVILGPIHARAVNAFRRAPISPGSELLPHLMATLRRKVEEHPNAIRFDGICRRAIRDELVNVGLSVPAATTLSESAIAEPINAIWCKTTGHRLPRGLSASYASLVATIYGDARFSWRGGNKLAAPTRAHVIGTLLRLGGSATPKQLSQAMGGQPGAMRIIQLAEPLEKGHFPYPPSIEKAPGWNPSPGVHAAPNRVQLVACRHCGRRATLVLRVPEVPDALLCPDCGRMPRIARSPVFPDVYQELADHPREEVPDTGRMHGRPVQGHGLPDSRPTTSLQKAGHDGRETV